MAPERVSDLTVDELRQLIREAVREALAEIRQAGEDDAFDWDAVSEAVMERFNEAWRRLSEL